MGFMGFARASHPLMAHTTLDSAYIIYTGHPNMAQHAPSHPIPGFLFLPPRAPRIQFPVFLQLVGATDPSIAETVPRRLSAPLLPSEYYIRFSLDSFITYT
jgi:hypothetical protein